MGRDALRLLLFVDPKLASSMTLLAASLKIGGTRDDIEVAAIVDTVRQPPSPLRLPRAIAAWGLRGIFNLNTAAELAVPPLFATCASLARRRRIPVLAPRERGVNDSSFVEKVRQLEPDATINLMGAQIFRSPLLAACNAPINYHDGLLPQYQGVAATGWSIYEKAPMSGFTFHRMTEDVDKGPILLQGAVPLGPRAAAAPIDRAKSRLACSQLNSLFDLLVSPAANSVHEVEPGGPGSSFSRAALQAIRSIDDPETLSLDELELRLRAFETIDLTLAGRRWSTTALRRVGRRPRNRQLAFTTVDGVWVEPSRLMHLQPVVYRSLRSVYGLP